MPKPPATTATTAAQAISQRYATVLARWPADPTRRGRNLKELLERRVQQRVDAFTRSDDGSICEYTDAEREVDARREMLWTRLAENCYAGKFPTATAFEPIHRGSYALLSSQTQNDQFKVRSTSVFVPLVRSYIQHKLAQWGISGERATSSSGSGSTPTINGKKK